MKRFTVATILALIIAIPLIVVSYVIFTQPTAQTAPTKATPQEILEQVNEERAKVGAKQLVVSEKLTKSAQERADDMVARKYYSHYDPVTGESMIDKQDTGCRQSENLNNGMLYYDAEQTVESWMGSEPHRNAMLSDDYSITGIAISGDYVVEHFCE